MAMKVGIGCITYNRPAHIQHWAKMIADYSPETAIVHIANDNVERKGVAFRSNECLRELYNEGCDYFFLFNDDCFPIKAGWEQFFIEALKASGQNHFIYTHETPGVKLIQSHPHYITQYLPEPEVTIEYRINQYDACNGVLMVMTRAAVEKVGGYNPAFKVYGYEHADYSNRIHLAGLNSMGAYLCPAGAEEYIYSLDLDNHMPELHKKLKHKGSMPAKEALFCVQQNERIYNMPKQIHYPL